MRRHNDNLIELHTHRSKSVNHRMSPALSRWASVPLLDGVLDTCDEEGRRNPENHQTVGGLQWRNQPQAAMQYDVAITERRECYA